MQTRFTVSVTMWYTEKDAELGHEYEATGQKDANGLDIWGYTPSVRGPKDTCREIFKADVDEIDITALANVVIGTGA